MNHLLASAPWLDWVRQGGGIVVGALGARILGETKIAFRTAQLKRRAVELATGLERTFSRDDARRIKDRVESVISEYRDVFARDKNRDIDVLVMDVKWNLDSALLQDSEYAGEALTHVRQRAAELRIWARGF